MGFFITHVYKNLKGNCFCIAYEPHLLNYVLLKLNCKFNNVGRYISKPYALSAKEGKTKLYIRAESGWHSIRLWSPRTITVILTTLDHELKYILSQALASLTALSIEKLSIYVKIDVEGAEEEVLKGSVQLIRILKPYIILEVYKDPYQYSDLVITLYCYALRF